jgi:L,D-transpeptidase YcbB
MRIRTIAATMMVLLCAIGRASASSEPSYGPRSYDLTLEAYQLYLDIEARGGWSFMPKGSTGLKLGSAGAPVTALKTRLALTNDLPATQTVGDTFDAETATALRRFQLRHGLSDTGIVGPLTIRALNVPIDVRLRQLSASLERLQGNGFVFAKRHVVVNIPGASVEAVEDGVVAQRHVAVVGRPDRPSPVLEARIGAVNLNPTWTVPLSIVKADIMPKVAKDHSYLAKSNMRVLGAGGVELNPSTIDWSGKSAVNFIIRQDSGPLNSLGQIRIDMPNTHAVYLHDTPKRELFRSDIRFHSSGCARVSDVRGLATWLLRGSEWDQTAIETAIATGERKDIKLHRAVPVAWVYLTGWGLADGTVHFRDDIYGLDNSPEEIVASTLQKRTIKTASPKVDQARQSVGRAVGQAGSLVSASATDLR